MPKVYVHFIEPVEMRDGQHNVEESNKEINNIIKWNQELHHMRTPQR